MEKNLELQEMTVEEMKTFIKLGKKKEEIAEICQITVEEVAEVLEE